MPSVSASAALVPPSPAGASPDDPPAGHPEPPEHLVAGLVCPAGTYSGLVMKIINIGISDSTQFVSQITKMSICNRKLKLLV